MQNSINKFPLYTLVSLHIDSNICFGSAYFLITISDLELKTTSLSVIIGNLFYTSQQSHATDLYRNFDSCCKYVSPFDYSISNSIFIKYQLYSIHNRKADSCQPLLNAQYKEMLKVVTLKANYAEHELSYMLPTVLNKYVEVGINFLCTLTELTAIPKLNGTLSRKII